MNHAFESTKFLIDYRCLEILVLELLSSKKANHIKPCFSKSLLEQILNFASEQYDLQLKLF